MAKRKKNAGEGYGYMFSGAFNKKADAVKKEKQRKGSFVKAVMTRSGMRYAVMTPRDNPPKRKKRANAKDYKILKDATGRNYWYINEDTADRLGLLHSNRQGIAFNRRGAMYAVKRALKGQDPNAHDNPAHANPSNPSELLVLGANPTNRAQEFNLPVGSTITIRVNPTENISGAMIDGYQCTRKPNHRGPHLPQGATIRPVSRLPHNWKKRNPTAEAIREDFTGAPADGYTTYNVEGMPAGEYAQLGELLSLYVKPPLGGQVREIRFQKPRPILVTDTTARQLYFVGGDQEISEEGLKLFNEETAGTKIELGACRRIDYKQRKEHVPDPDIDEWRHNFGEETGVKPSLYYDRLSRRLLLKGGAYEVRPEGITN